MHTFRRRYKNGLFLWVLPFHTVAKELGHRENVIHRFMHIHNMAYLLSTSLHNFKVSDIFSINKV